MELFYIILILNLYVFGNNIYIYIIYFDINIIYIYIEKKKYKTLINF